MEKIASIDIGSSCIKMIIVHKSLRKSEIAECIMKTLSGEQPYFDEVTAILGELKQEYDLDNHTVITALPQELVLTRTFSFPFTGTDVLREIVLQEVAETLPLSPDEMVWNIKIAQQKTKQSDVLFAAAGAQAAALYFECFTKNEISPAFAGLESEAIYDAVRYTKTDPILDYIHCDIGNRKTIVTIVQNGIHFATESIPAGIGDIVSHFSKMLKTDAITAASKLEQLHLDIDDVESNYNTGFYKSLKLSKKQLEAVFDKTHDVLNEIASRIHSTVQIIRDENETASFEQLFVTGGGANIRNLGNFLSQATKIPLASCEILSNTNNRQIQTRFFTVFGLIHSYHEKRERVNLIASNETDKNESPLSKFYPAVLLGCASFIIIMLALLLSLIFTGSQQAKNRELLAQQFTKLYRTKLEKDQDPIAEAKALLQAEKKRRESLEIIAPRSKTSIQILAEITKSFPDDGELTLASITMSESTISVNGSSPDTAILENFKNNLSASDNFESVTLNTNITSRSGTSFTMTIKSKSLNNKETKPTDTEKADD